MKISEIQVGDNFEDVLLETYRDGQVSRPRVRPIEYFPDGINVEFPRKLRDEFPIGTRFRANVKVCQKTEDGKKPKGPPYLLAAKNSIMLVRDYNPSINIIPILRPGSRSRRTYDYKVQKSTKGTECISFSQLRAMAYDLNATPKSLRGEVGHLYHKRNELIKIYAIQRAKGMCEKCGKNAPFVRKNGMPYLEVHHIEELSGGGLDSPMNVAAICPNCHAHVTHGVDREEQNKALKGAITKREESSIIDHAIDRERLRKLYDIPTK